MTSFTQLSEHLLQAHTAQTLSHAYAIAGPAGVGKTLLVNQLCAQMYTEKAQQVASTVWVQPLEGEGKTKTKKDISVEQIREVRAALTGGSLFGGHRMVIITPADAMNAAAANSLLKVLEEAPQNTTFMLLLQDWKAVPETILSRCQVFGLSPATIAGGDAVLAQYTSDEQERHRALKAAHGLLGHAHTILTNPEFAQQRFEHTNMFYELRGTPIHKQRAHITPLLGDTTDHIKQRRLLDQVFATWQCEAGVVLREQVAQQQPVSAMTGLIAQLAQARHDITHNMHPKVVMENLMFRFYDAA